jgi:hypothetical protein
VIVRNFIGLLPYPLLNSGCANATGASSLFMHRSSTVLGRAAAGNGRRWGSPATALQCANRKGKAMKISRIALFAALGVVAVAFPAAAAPVSGESTDVRAAKPALQQLAQVNASRAANEARGGNFKKAKAKKKKAM